MPLSDAGVRFSSEGFTEFLRNMATAAKAISGFGDVTEEEFMKANDAMLDFAQTLDSIDRIIMAFSDTDLSGVFKGLIEGAENAKNKVSDKLKSIFPDVFKTMKTVLGDVAKYAVSGARTGGMIGGIIGVLFPTIGEEPFTTLIGSLTGALVGALYGMAKGIWDAAGQAINGIQDAFHKLFGGISDFITQTVPGVLGKIAKAGLSIAEGIFGFAKTIISMAGKVLGSIWNAITGLFSSIISVFTGGGGAGRGGWRSLGNTIFEAMFKFEILKQVIRKVIDEIKTFSKEAFTAAQELQVLNIRFDNLIATQIRAAGLTKDFAASLKMAIPYSKELLKWIQQLALATPVSVDDIARITYLSMAMGWSVKAAKSLTSAIVDYTATLGMGSEISERIIYNFAQMKQQGKVTGTELRDLGRGAFMPINDILKIMYKDMGDVNISFEEFRKKASAGEVSVEGFFKAFEEFVAVNMPDAAKRLNYTFEATIQNLHDLFKIFLGWNVFGPTIASITKPLQDFISRFKEATTLAKANLFGKALAYVIDHIRLGFSYLSQAIGNVIKALGFATPSITDVVKVLVKLGMTISTVMWIIRSFILKLIPFADQIHDKFGDKFDEMGKDFFGWGLNLMLQFAKGIITGAAKAITAAINFVARLLTGWFKTGSPPAILPDIDKWGMETINEWLHGFTQADFDILDDIKSIVKDVLGAITDLGLISPEQSTQMYANLSAGLIEALDEFNRTGKISTGIFDELANIGGVYGKEVAELVQLQLQHIQALEKETQAQKDYDAAVKARLKAETKVNGLIRQYNSLLRKGAGKGSLKDQLKIVNAAEVERNVAVKTEMTKKEELDIAKEQLAVIEDQVKLQESLIKQLVDLVAAQKEVAGGAEDTAEALDEEIQTMLDGLGDVGSAFDEIDFEAIVKEAEWEFIKQFNGFVNDIGNTWYNAFTNPDAPFQLAIGNMKTAWSGLITSLRQTWDEFAAAVHLPSWEEITSAWSNVTGPTITGKDTRGRPTREVNQPSLIDRFKAVVDQFAQDIKSNGGILKTLQDVASWVWTQLITALANWINPQPIQTETKPWLDAITPPDPGQQIGSKVLEWIGDALDWMNTNITQNERIQSGLSSLGSSIAGGILSGFEEATTGYVAAHPFAPGAVGQNILTSIANGVTNLIGLIRDKAGAKSPATEFEPIGSDIVEGIGVGFYNATKDVTIIDKFNNGVDEIISIITTALNGVNGNIATNPFYTIGKNIVQGIIDGINSLLSNLQNVIAEIAAQVPAWLKKLWGESSPSKVFMGIGKNAMLGLVKGIEDAYPDVSGALTSAMDKKIFNPSVSKQAVMNAQPVYAGTTVNFGDVHINNAMDWAMFKSQVHKAIVEG